MFHLQIAQLFSSFQQQPETVPCSIWQQLDVHASLQVVVVYGANPAGACIVAEMVYSSLPKVMAQSGLSSLHQYAGATGMSPSAVLGAEKQSRYDLSGLGL